MADPGSEDWDPREGRGRSLFLAVCGPSAPYFLCLKFPSAPKGKLDPFGNKKLADSCSPGCVSLSVCTRELWGRRASGGVKGRLALRGRQTPFSWSTLQEPCQPVLRHRLSCRTTNPWGTGTAFPSSLHPLSTQLVLSRMARRSEDTLGGAVLTAPLGRVCSCYPGSIGRPVPKCWCALQIAGIWKTLKSKRGLGRSQKKSLVFMNGIKAELSPLFQKGKVKKAHISL